MKKLDSKIAGCIDMVVREFLQTQPKNFGAILNDAFINSGFVSVKSRIDHINRFYGSNAYHMDADIATDKLLLRLNGDIDLLLLESSASFEKLSELAGMKTWNEFAANNQLRSSTKREVCRRFFPDIYEDIHRSQLEAFAKAKKAEYSNHCEIVSYPGEELRSPQKIELRAKLYNELVSDAFSSLGFVKKRVSGGVIILHKKIGDFLYVTIEMDRVELKRNVLRLGLIPFSEPRLQFNPIGSLQLGFNVNLLFSGGVKNELFPLYHSPYSYAAQLTEQFWDSCSLEVAIRAFSKLYTMVYLPQIELIKSRCFDDNILECPTKVGLANAIEQPPDSQLETSPSHQPPKQAADDQTVLDNASNEPEQESVLLSNFCVHMLSPAQWTQERADELDSLTGALRSFSVSEGWTGVELEFEKAISLLDPSFVRKGDQLHEEICNLSQQQPLMVLHYAEDHGWGWNVWDKGRCIGGYRLDLEEDSVHHDAALKAVLQPLGLEPLQIDQMLATLPEVGEIKANENGWIAMSDQIRQFLGVIGICVEG